MSRTSNRSPEGPSWVRAYAVRSTSAAGTKGAFIRRMGRERISDTDPTIRRRATPTHPAAHTRVPSQPPSNVVATKSPTSRPPRLAPRPTASTAPPPPAVRTSTAPPPAARVSKPPPLPTSVRPVSPAALSASAEPITELESVEAELIAEPAPADAAAAKTSAPAPPRAASPVPASAAVRVPPSMPVQPVAVSLPPVGDAPEPDSLASSPFRSGLPTWARPAALTIALLGIGFLAGRMTAPSPASPSDTAAQAAAAEVAPQAPAASPTAPVATAVAPPTATTDPVPNDNPIAATPPATATAPSTQSAPPTQPTATTRAVAAEVIAKQPPQVDPFVQAVQQDIQQELDSRKTR